jgi:regulator of cell morphogenesis and NO signaling
MLILDTNTTIGQFVADHPATARVFEHYGIDYCCGGKDSLAEACARQRLNPQTVLAALQQATDAFPDVAATDWTQAPLAELIDHIITTHHAYLRTELPRLATLAGKVAAVHGERHPELVECRAIYGALQDELESHMRKEELILFPMIKQMEATQSTEGCHCGSIAGPIRVMEMEHGSAGDALARLRELTGGYVAPADACSSYRAYLEGLAALEADLHRHIHKENSILFPRALRMESDVCAAG